jgi:hypothetical protein
MASGLKERGKTCCFQTYFEETSLFRLLNLGETILFEVLDFEETELALRVVHFFLRIYRLSAPISCGFSGRIP